jgi:hypothetical protein
MEVARFVTGLPALFEDFPASPHPRGLRFDDVLERTPNLAEENVLALLNLAASLLAPGESYVEVGSYFGASLIGAMRGNDYDSQARGLRAVEPWLADEALIVVDDHDWKDVARGVRDYLAAEQRAELLFAIAGGDHGQPQWWDGVAVIGWRG